MASLDMRSYYGKRICLLRNGDKHWSKKFVVNPRTRTLDSFMNDLTPVVRMPVRKVFTPNHGNRVTNLGQLQSNGSYVIAGGEAFKNIRYSEVREPVVPRLLPAKGPEILIPGKHGPYRNVPGRARNYAISKPQGMLTIRVFCNGVVMPSRRVRFPRHLNMNQVLECVNEKVCSVIGAVFYLFRVDGLKISQPSQLENNGYYVAIGREGRFKSNVFYSDNVDVAQITPRRASTKPTSKKAQPFNKFGVVSKRTRKKKSMRVERLEPVETLREESKRFSGSEDSVTSDRGVADRSQAPEEQLIKGETSVLGGTGVPLDDILNGHRQSVGKSLVYEASGELQENAAEIQDDKETREDKPIDQMPAEEVTEEEIEDDGPQEQEESQKTRL